MNYYNVELAQRILDNVEDKEICKKCLHIIGVDEEGCPQCICTLLDELKTGREDTEEGFAH